MNGTEISLYELDGKIFNDPVHKSFCIPPLCIAIMDTPQFQRLRNIRQLGLASYVYPGATHTRFDHCLGVCYLAGEFVKMLKEKQNSAETGFEIDERDILCVQIAGLCHDLGHGPFSHFWEHFLKKADPSTHWSHEECSVQMFDHLIEKNCLIKKFEVYFGQHYKEYMVYIKEQIGGGLESRKQNPWIVNGRDKSFLYEIVANKITGIDVDKFDYLTRDCYYMGINGAFDYCHIMQFARVCKTEGNELHICFRDKERDQLADVFRLRRTLHRVGFQHRVVIALDTMLTDILTAADNHFQIRVSDKKLRLSEVQHDIEAFSLLTDEILYAIRMSEDENLNEAKKIWNRIEQRNFYRYVGKARIDKVWADEINSNSTKFSTEILNLVKEDLRCLLTPEDIILNMLVFDNGEQVRRPLESLYFYSKRDQAVGRRLNSSLVTDLHRQNFQEIFLLCLCKNPNYRYEVTDAFTVWCHNNNLIIVDNESPMH